MLWYDVIWYFSMKTKNNNQKLLLFFCFASLIFGFEWKMQNDCVREKDRKQNAEMAASKYNLVLSNHFKSNISSREIYSLHHNSNVRQPSFHIFTTFCNSCFFLFFFCFPCAIFVHFKIYSYIFFLHRIHFEALYSTVVTRNKVKVTCISICIFELNFFSMKRKIQFKNTRTIENMLE